MLALRCKYALLLSVLLSSTAGAGELGWAVYIDAKHGCKVHFPKTLFASAPSRANGPKRFAGPGMYFDILGAENLRDWSADEIKRKFLDGGMPGIVIHQRRQGNFVILSGYRSGNVFQTKVALSDDLRTACFLDINYPLENRKLFDQLAMQMARSFTVAGN